MKLYIMRHGETDGNRAKMLQGRLDNPLNDTGRKQALLAGKQLEDVQFDVCYVSPLKRTMETAEIVTGWNRDRFMLEERILEISFGGDEGKTLEELGTEFQSFFLDPDHYEPLNGGESFDALLARVGAFLDELKEKEDVYDNVLIISHGAAIHGMLLLIEGRQRKDFWKVDIGNCGVTEAMLDGSEWKVTKACQTTDSYYGKGKVQ